MIIYWNTKTFISANTYITNIKQFLITDCSNYAVGAALHQIMNGEPTTFRIGYANKMYYGNFIQRRSQKHSCGLLWQCKLTYMICLLLLKYKLHMMRSFQMSPKVYSSKQGTRFYAIYQDWYRLSIQDCSKLFHISNFSFFHTPELKVHAK